jgi:hypothetical protein
LRPVYGFSVGIVMQADTLVRLPGDVGNATTFPFPVLYHIVEGVDPSDLKRPERARAAAPAFVGAARALARAGVRVIGTGCGFLSILQQDLQEAVDVPVLSSSLIQVPWISRFLPAGGRVGIITADSRALTDEYFAPLGWTSTTVPIAIAGVEREERFLALLSRGEVSDDDLATMHRSMGDLARDFVERHPDIRALVLECTNLPPFAATIQQACRRPVFDVVTLLMWAHAGAVRRPFVGYL